MLKSEVVGGLRRLFTALSVVLLASGVVGAAHSAALVGVTFPDQATVSGKPVVLNGLGVRSATMLKVKVYVIGLYLESKSGDPQAIIDSNGNKRIAMHFVHDVSAEKLRGGWTEGFEENAKDVAGVKKEIAKFNASMRDVKSGDTIVLDVFDDNVDVLINDSRVDSIAGKDFQRALLSIWLGPKPPNEELKEGILGH